MRWCVQDLKRESDEVLARMAQGGDGAAEEELLNRYKSTVRARARKFFLEGGETEDPSGTDPIINPETGRPYGY